MRELGLFGALVPASLRRARARRRPPTRAIIEEICRGWMSLAGVINSHTMAALIVLHHGTDEQRARLLPRFARGEARGGLCLTEPHAGSDVQAIRTVARRRGDDYVLDGSKMFVTNGREGNTFALLALTDPRPSRGIAACRASSSRRGIPGLRVAKSIAKLGYKGVDTAELVFEDFAGAGGQPRRRRRGPRLQARDERARDRAHQHRRARRRRGAGRVGRHARHARAARARRPIRGSRTWPAQLHGARLLTYWAAGMKDRGERCDLEAGMAKLHASETAQTLAETALRVLGERAILDASQPSSATTATRRS